MSEERVDGTADAGLEPEDAGPARVRRSQGSAMRLGVVSTVMYNMPRFLIGALAVQLTSELDFGTVGLGGAVAINRLAAAGMAPVAGRIADRIGASASIRIAGVVTLVASIGIATLVDSWMTLTLWLVFLASADALGQPGANRLLSMVVGPNRLGTAFGLKQAAPPAASMLAGISVPVLAIALGWRSPFLLVAAIALGVVVSTRRSSGSAPRRPEPGPSEPLAQRSALFALTVALGFATATTSAVTTFFVIAAVRAGGTEQYGAIILAVASAAAVATRVASGWWIDRSAARPLVRYLRVCSAFVLLGCFGVGLLATGEIAFMTAGVIIALATGWGYPAIFWFVLVRAYPEAPGRLSGVVFPGALIGSTAGPSIFGFLAERTGFSFAWLVVVGLALAGAVTMFVASPRLLSPPASPDGGTNDDDGRRGT